VRKEVSVLILIALLANASPASAQEDSLEDEDLQTLLEEKPSSSEEVSATTEVSTAPSEQPASDPAPSFATESTINENTPLEPEDVLSDTVELDSLEDTLPSEETKISGGTGDTPENQPDSLDTLDPLPSETASSEADDLEALKNDLDTEEGFKPEEKISETESFEPAKPSELTEEQKTADKSIKVAPRIEQPSIFDVGKEERELLVVAQNIQGQISDNEWNEVATAAKRDTYTVVKDDWLFKISKRLFGTGFYYPKIWSLNSYIVNPHFIEPGMILSFTTGSGSSAPEFKLGAFTDDELQAAPGSLGSTDVEELGNFGENNTPGWVKEKDDLQKQGIFFQYASDETMEDIERAGKKALNREYENYEPPRNEFEIVLPKNYDPSGFDKNSRIFYSFKEGFYLSTFLTTNIVQDLGSIVNGPDENIFFVQGDRAYIELDESVNALPGDKFSIYSTGGRVSHKNSDREGFKYTIVGQIKLIKKFQNKWEVEFTDVAGTPQRSDRVTVYTPKMDRITRTYNSRLIEAALISPFEPGQNIMGQGDVVFIDRGRADGVEMGNVFEVYGFKDRLSQKNITDQPTYLMGELAVITLTDNFATCLVINSRRDFYAGDVAATKTKEAHLREVKAREARLKGDRGLIDGKSLDELDVELNLENMNDDLLKQADKIELTEDELAELERQEREKSVIKDSERDLKALERLENEIESAEKILNDAKLDEDKLLEGENLNDIEKKQSSDPDSVDEIEENLGKRYLDEDINSKDNPYGLTEFDVEEVDELLNVEKNETKPEN
jgi:nucleoid-associated protein YgaU